MTIAIKLPAELEMRLSALAKQTHRSKSYYARAAIANYIEDLEDYYLAIQVLENNEDTMSLEELEKQIDLAN